MVGPRRPGSGVGRIAAAVDLRGAGDADFGESGKGLDKAYENKSIDGVLSAPPSALAGLTEDDDKLLTQLGIKTVRDLGSNKHFALAGTLVALSTKTG